MAKSYKDQHAADDKLLVEMRKHLAEASALLNKLSAQTGIARRALLSHGLDLAEKEALEAHKTARFGATGELLEEV